MHSMDNYYVSKLLPLMRRSGGLSHGQPVDQHHHSGAPRYLPETPWHDPGARNAGRRALTWPSGHDCVMDPWYSLGSADMLEVAQMGLHVAQMTGQKAMRQCFDAVTETPARILGLSDYGLRAGARADAVLLQACDPVEAIRLRATRLCVIREGRVIAKSPASAAQLNLPGRPGLVDWRS